MAGIKLNVLLLLLQVLTLLLASQSLLRGRISILSVKARKQEAIFRPLTEEPKISNIKDSFFEFIVVPEAETCGDLGSKYARNAGEPPVIILVDFSQVKQLSCGLFNKIKSIKEAGGYGFIIVTDNSELPVSHCRMFDDNNFFTAVMDTLNFNVILQNVSSTLPTLGSVTIEFRDPTKKLLQVWTSSLSSASYENLNTLGRVIAKLPSMSAKIELMPRVSLLGCNHGQNTNICSQDDYVASCACKGQFCSPEAHRRAPIALVQEDLRQLLLSQQYPSKYFSYLSQFNQKCLKSYQQNYYAEDCAQNLLSKLGVDSASLNLAISQFINACGEQGSQQQQIYSRLSRDKAAFFTYGRYPLLLLNKKILQFKSQEDLAGQLCRELSLQDEGCFTIVNEKTVSSTIVGGMFYALLVVFLLATGALVVYFYRKKLKRDMNKQIKMQVSTAVDHYFALTEIK